MQAAGAAERMTHELRYHRCTCPECVQQREVILTPSCSGSDANLDESSDQLCPSPVVHLQHRTASCNCCAVHNATPATPTFACCAPALDLLPPPSHHLALQADPRPNAAATRPALKVGPRLSLRHSLHWALYAHLAAALAAAALQAVQKEDARASAYPNTQGCSLTTLPAWLTMLDNWALPIMCAQTSLKDSRIDCSRLHAQGL
jgi:hypothetical protein